MVAVGLLRVDVAGRVLRELAVLALGAVAAIGLGVGLAVVAARRVRRDTLGLEPAEITALHRHHEAVLHAMREGLLVLDERDRLAVVNDEAARLLGLDAHDRPHRTHPRRARRRPGPAPPGSPTPARSATRRCSSGSGCCCSTGPAPTTTAAATARG